MSPLLLCSVFILMLTCIFTWAGQNFVNVTDCPKDANEWELKSKMKNCYGDTPDYLCAAIENMLGQYGEICTKKRWIPENKCAVLNAQTHNLDSVDCKADIGCPPNMILSSEVWRWPICFGDFYGSKSVSNMNKSTFLTTPSHIETKVQEMTTSIVIEQEAVSGDFGLIIVVIMATLIGSLLVVVILCKQFKWRLMNRSSVRGITHFIIEQTSHEDLTRDINSAEIQEDETESPFVGSEDAYLYRYIEPSCRLQKDDAFGAKDLSSKLAALKHYLVDILKHSCKMEELKDVTVLFKSSIVEHFDEALLNSLCNLNSLDDFQKLDISLVYNLLRNVCKNVNPPKRGWGYEPSADDVSLGADIERIHSMWNRYCDGETEFSYLREIFIRMIDRYGNISDVVKSEDTGKKKILSFEMNPECQEEDGVVLTKALKAVLDILEQEYCVVVKGAVGTGKSTCLNYIDRHYRRKQWEVRRKVRSITQSDVYVPVDETRKLLCCDDLFGVYNRGNFAGTAEIITTLENIEQKVNQNMKIVLAIHDHVYEELQKSHYIKVFQNKRVVVDFNELSDAEMLLIFNDQRKNGHCSKNPKCWFRNVGFDSIKDTLKENTGKLGNPILTLLYSNLHDTFAQKKDTQDIVKELCSIFQNMLENNPDLFHVLLYVMFVETHSLDKNVEKWASKLGGLDSTMVEQNVCHLDSFLFVQADGRRIKIKHELLSFALFKWCASSTRYLPLLLKHCQFQMIEEIIRPIDSPNQSEFCVILKEEMYHVLNSRILEENLILYVQFHPLMESSKFRYSLYSMRNSEPLIRESLVVQKKNHKDKSPTKKNKSADKKEF